MYMQEIEEKNDEKERCLYAKMTQALRTQYLPLTIKQRKLQRQKEIEQQLRERNEFLIRTRRESLYGQHVATKLNEDLLDDEQNMQYIFPTSEQSSLFGPSVKEKKQRATRSHDANDITMSTTQIMVTPQSVAQSLHQTSIDLSISPKKLL